MQWYSRASFREGLEGSEGSTDPQGFIILIFFPVNSTVKTLLLLQKQYTKTPRITETLKITCYNDATGDIRILQIIKIWLWLFLIEENKKKTTDIYRYAFLF